MCPHSAWNNVSKKRTGAHIKVHGYRISQYEGTSRGLTTAGSIENEESTSHFEG